MVNNEINSSTVLYIYIYPSINQPIYFSGSTHSFILCFYPNIYLHIYILISISFELSIYLINLSTHSDTISKYILVEMFRICFGNPGLRNTSWIAARLSRQEHKHRYISLKWRFKVTRSDRQLY